MSEQELENMMFIALACISKEMAEDFAQPVNADYIENWTGDMITIRVKQHIFGKQILHEELFYPADWIQAFKERWFPAWAKKRWPVCYETQVFDVREVVPSLDIPGHKSLIVTGLRRGGSDGMD